MDLAIIKQLGVAIALAGLIGLERERKALVSFGGVRTFILIGLLGAISYFLSSISLVY
ncbi:hypothetical protein GF354_00035, partial [Candidatus Peregrinibacteria bacterium]|nr:hypothetical protein [Candidatus Peregrinibacteria bacterium]